VAAVPSVGSTRVGVVVSGMGFPLSGPVWHALTVPF
jgi:hypothetical protein